MVSNNKHWSKHKQASGYSMSSNSLILSYIVFVHAAEGGLFLSSALHRCRNGFAVQPHLLRQASLGRLLLDVAQTRLVCLLALCLRRIQRSVGKFFLSEEVSVGVLAATPYFEAFKETVVRNRVVSRGPSNSSSGLNTFGLRDPLELWTFSLIAACRFQSENVERGTGSRPEQPPPGIFRLLRPALQGQGLFQKRDHQTPSGSLVWLQLGQDFEPSSSGSANLGHRAFGPPLYACILSIHLRGVEVIESSCKETELGPVVAVRPSQLLPQLVLIGLTLASKGLKLELLCNPILMHN